MASISPGIRRKISKALIDHGMIEKGSRIIAGLSGGKDSLLLLTALSELRSHGNMDFDLAAVTVDITGQGVGFETLTEYCRNIGVRHELITYPILDIIREKEERSPCSLCSNLRNGILFGYAAEKAYDTVALGHNLDDVVETVIMNLFLAGRFRCFAPRSWRSRKKIWAIRPMIYVSKNAITEEASRLGLPVTASRCPWGETTKRQEMKELLGSLEPRFPALKSQILHALINVKRSDIWGFDDDTPESPVKAPSA